MSGHSLVRLSHSATFFLVNLMSLAVSGIQVPLWALCKCMRQTCPGNSRFSLAEFSPTSASYTKEFVFILCLFLFFSAFGWYHLHLRTEAKNKQGLFVSMSRVYYYKNLSRFLYLLEVFVLKSCGFHMYSKLEYFVRWCDNVSFKSNNLRLWRRWLGITPVVERAIIVSLFWRVYLYLCIFLYV